MRVVASAECWLLLVSTYKQALAGTLQVHKACPQMLLTVWPHLIAQVHLSKLGLVPGWHGFLHLHCIPEPLIRGRWCA